MLAGALRPYTRLGWGLALALLSACGGDGEGTPTPQNLPPQLLRLEVNPAVVEPGALVQVSALAEDPENDPLTWHWTAPSGQFAAPTLAETSFTAEAIIFSVMRERSPLSLK